MSFRLNTNQQMAIYDSLFLLTEREIKHLKSSWAEIFSKKIFPIIKEDRFRVLYNDNSATRTNNPVNVYFGLLILKELFNQSDEEALDSLMFDIRYQHALHTTSFKEQLVSKNSMNSLMISFSCKRLSRLGLIYSSVKQLIKVMAQANIRLPENLKVYLEEGQYHDTIYRSKNKDLNSKLKIVLTDALKLYSLYLNFLAGC